MKSSLVCVLLLAGGAASLRASYPIGSHEVPAVIVQPRVEAFAVYERHPRLFFRDTDLPEIRRRIAGELKPEWEEMLADLNRRALPKPARMFGEGVYLKSWETGRDVAFVAAVTGEGRYVAWAKDWAAALVAAGPVGNDDNYRGRLQSLAVAYDWLYSTWTDAEKRALQEAILAHIARNWSFGEKPNFISGHSRWGNFALAAGLLAVATERPEVREQLHVVRRNWIEGYFPAQGWVAADGGYHMGWSYSAAYLTGGIHLAWSTATNECVFFPWQAKLPAFWIYGRQGDRAYPNTGDAYTNSKDLNTGDRALLMIAAGILKDPYAAGAVTRTWDRFTDVLYADKSVRARAANDPAAPLPLSRHFRNAGVVIARDTWDERATVLQFKSTSFFSVNHHHRDENSFTLHYRAPLAIDSGYYDSYGSPHWRNYFTRTIAHNALVVFDPEQKFLLFGQPVANDGGQIMPSEPSSLADIAPGGTAHLGGITRYEDTPDYTYSAGDATKAYDPQRVRLAAREIVYLRRTSSGHPVVVVLDRIESAKPNLVKKFLLHTVAEPKVQGNLAVTENQGARLTSLTLLPEHAKLERIGGAGREAWVDGKNYPFETTRSLGAEFTPGGWRLEVSPGAPQLRDTFLHVLWVDDAGAPAMTSASAQLVKTSDGVGVNVGGWAVQFPIDPAGKCRIVAAR